MMMTTTDPKGAGAMTTHAEGAMRAPGDASLGDAEGAAADALGSRSQVLTVGAWAAPPVDDPSSAKARHVPTIQRQRRGYDR